MKNTKVMSCLKKSAPTILSILSCVGVVATAVVSSKAAIKAVTIVNEKTESEGNLTKAETLKSCWKCYIPSVAIGASTILCIAGANLLNRSSQATLMSAYAMLNEAHQKYRKAANTVYGENADSNIKAQVARDVYVSNSGYSLYDPNACTGDSMLFYDDFSERYFTTTIAAVVNAEYHINRNLQLRGYAYLNEFYEFLGLEETPQGTTIGWSMTNIYESGFSWLDFDNRLIKLEDGMEVYIVYSVFSPDVFDEDDC